MKLPDQPALPRIYFHHIGKTAGTSLRDFLVARVGESNVAPMLRTGRMRDALRDYARFTVITGHLDVLAGDRLPSDRVSVTLLREPVDRLVSGFHFQKHVYNAGRRGSAGDAADLESWLASLVTKEQIDGLNGHVCALWPLGWTNDTDPTTAEKVDAARRALDAFDVVGLQSSMIESVVLLCHRLRWPPPDAAPHSNRTPGRVARADLPPGLVRRLEELLAPDLEIYAYACSLFRRRMLDVLRAAAATAAIGGRADAASGDAAPEATVASPAHAPTAPEVFDGQAVAPTVAAGVRGLRIEAVGIQGQISEADYLQVGETAMVTVRVSARIAVRDLNIGFAVRDAAGALMFATNTRSLGDNVQVTPGTYVAVFTFPNDLGVGHYLVSASLHRGQSLLDGYLHHVDHACEFAVVDRLTEYFEGRVRLRVGASIAAVDGDGCVRISPIEETGYERFALLAYRNPALTDFSAHVEPLVRLAEIRRAADSIAHVEVTNTGSLPWGAFGKRAVAVSYHWFAATGAALVFDGLRTPLPHDVKPGERVRMPCFLRAPDTPGRMTLVWTLVQENVAWFNERNARACWQAEIDVIT